MNRKKFLLLSGVVASAIAIPVLTRHARNARLDRPLFLPGSLAGILDQETIREIGLAYRSATPSEDAEPGLTRLLLTAPDGSRLPAEDRTAVRRMLERKVHDDFETGSIRMVNGWILSVTEARQCALFSMTVLPG